MKTVKQRLKSEWPSATFLTFYITDANTNGVLNDLQVPPLYVIFRTEIL